MLVYRYLNEAFALEALQKRELKVGRLGELNDPADCVPTLTGAPEQPNEEATAAFERSYLSEIYRDIGIVCFSATISDPVIWSHYADSHRGIAIGYEFHESGARLFDVVYQEERATLNYGEAELLRREKDPRAFIEKVIRYGFTRKAVSWSYEMEYRLFLNLYHCTMRGPHYFIKGMGPKKVVLGVNCRVTESDVIRMTRDGSLMGGITRARMDRQRYSLSVRFEGH